MDANEKLDALKKFRDQMEGKNHFELLGVPESATDDEVRKAYFGLMKLYGADYFHSVTDAGDRAAIEAVNKQLRVAYDGIGKAAKREAYAASLHGKAAPAEPAAEKIDIASVFEAEQALSLSRTLMDRGDFKIAISKLEKATRLDGKSQEVEARLCYCRFMLMDVDDKGKRKADAVTQTREQLEALAEALPNADYVRVYLGDLENLEGDEGKAQKWYKAALKINADNLPARRAVMMFENRSKEPEKKKEEAPQGFFAKLKEILTKKR